MNLTGITVSHILSELGSRKALTIDATDERMMVRLPLKDSWPSFLAAAASLMLLAATASHAELPELLRPLMAVRLGLEGFLRTCFASAQGGESEYPLLTKREAYLRSESRIHVHRDRIEVLQRCVESLPPRVGAYRAAIDGVIKAAGALPDGSGAETRRFADLLVAAADTTDRTSQLALRKLIALNREYLVLFQTLRAQGDPSANEQLVLPSQIAALERDIMRIARSQVTSAVAVFEAATLFAPSPAVLARHRLVKLLEALFRTVDDMQQLDAENVLQNLASLRRGVGEIDRLVNIAMADNDLGKGWPMAVEKYEVMRADLRALDALLGRAEKLNRLAVSAPTGPEALALYKVARSLPRELESVLDRLERTAYAIDTDISTVP